jgi:dihydrofolate synthase / folylpolyglutamate synthase
MPPSLLLDLDSVLLPSQAPGIRLGLERISNALALLGHPQEMVPAIHVAGSNGKGSVCAYVSSILQAAGYRVGRYNSPHLVSWNERICVDGQPIATDRFIELLHQVQETSPEPLTKFELLTATAWLHFARCPVDIAVIEVGLGGRLDATNVIQHPLVSVITSISREHWQQLGETLPEIAAEKAGILKANCPVVVGSLPATALAVIEAKAQILGCPLYYSVPARSVAPGVAALGDFEYALPLVGDIQLHNSALAIAAIQALPAKWTISESAIRQGIATTTWPGRLHQTTWQGREILLDGAHNPEAAIALRTYADRWQQPICWVLGMLNTKEHEPILRALLKPGDRLYLVPVNDELSMKPADLGAIVDALHLDVTVACFTDWQAGLNGAILRSEPVVMAGSLYLLGDFYRHCHPTGIL